MSEMKRPVRGNKSGIKNQNIKNRKINYNSIK